MAKSNNPIALDPANQAGLVRIMDEHADDEGIHVGVNENGETVHMSVFHDRIAVVTFQANGWTRKNVYWRDGTREELFEGKWL